jgi:hypothetical protein
VRGQFVQQLYKRTYLKTGVFRRQRTLPVLLHNDRKNTTNLNFTCPAFSWQSFLINLDHLRSVYTKHDFCVAPCRTTGSDTVNIDPNLIGRCRTHDATQKLCFLQIDLQFQLRTM